MFFVCEGIIDCLLGFDLAGVYGKEIHGWNGGKPFWGGWWMDV
jgi:hypothetical protein